jgi:hypothetical protein
MDKMDCGLAATASSKRLASFKHTLGNIINKAHDGIFGRFAG